MKTFITAAVAAALLATPAMAQTRAADRSADQLNARVLEVLRANQAPAPVVVSTAVSAAPAAPAPAASEPRLYAGLGVGYGGHDLANQNGTWSNQLTLGYNVNRYLAVEAVAAYDYGNSTRATGQTLVANALVGYDFGPVRPYALIGAGGGFGGQGNSNRDPDGIWNYGAGVAYAVNRSWQVDARYARVEGFRAEREGTDRFTVGVNYRF